MRPQVIAHRGASGREVENSLAAFKLAADMGADAVELDVHSTADGALIVFHDEMVGRMPVARTTLDELRTHRLGNGEHLPTLAEALDVILPRMYAYVEVKTLDPRWDARLFEAFDASPDAGRIAVHAFDHRIIKRLGVKRATLPRGVLLSSYVLEPVHVMQDAGAGAIWQRWQYVDRPLLDAVHQAKGEVHAWTADDPAAIATLLMLGADGICTNHPDRARAAIDSQSS